LGVLVVVFFKVEGGDCCLIVDADDDSTPWSCGGQEGGHCLLDCVEFSVIHLSLTA